MVTDTLPAGLTIRSATVAGGACTIAGQQVTCTVASLASGAQAEAQVRVTVASGQTAAIVNTGTVTSTTTDPTPGNNTAKTTTPVSRVADLEIIKSVDQKTVVAGTGLTYTLTVVNNGPSVATGTAVTDTLPAGLTYVDSTTTAGTCSATGQSFSCALGDVAPGTPGDRDHHRPGGPRLHRPVDHQHGCGRVDGDRPRQQQQRQLRHGRRHDQRRPVRGQDRVPGDARPRHRRDLHDHATNDGPSTAQGVVVSDTVPTGITINTATWGPVGHPLHRHRSGRRLHPRRGLRGPGLGEHHRHVGSQFAGTSVTNTTTITSTTDDPDPATTPRASPRPSWARPTSPSSRP